MLFTETSLPGAFLIDLERWEDERGFFARTFCAREFAERGLKAAVAQCSTSFSRTRGTIRGMHLQLPPVAETKLVRCTSGAIYDVIIDLRPDSPTYKQHFGLELSAENGRALYVPEMFAHGLQTLTDGAAVVYQSGEFYAPGSERGIRYDDPAFGIRWPLPVSVISPKDAAWPLFEQSPAGAGA
jgi:dTDP-4-dehydrorhamnose 3,5-epimerase